jgi:hypothetical protein
MIVFHVNATNSQAVASNRFPGTVCQIYLTRGWEHRCGWRRPRAVAEASDAGRATPRGITRTVALDVIKAQGLIVEERAFTLAEAYAAREAFEASATQIVMPIVSIDGHMIGDGKPEQVTKARLPEFHRSAEGRQAFGGISS